MPIARALSGQVKNSRPQDLSVESQAGHDGEHDGHGDTEPEARVDIERILSVLTSEQRAAATANDPVLVLAGAGTGKTRALTSAVIRRIADGTPSWRIIAVTYTNKAAHEMRERIASMLGEDVAPKDRKSTRLNSSH